MNKRNIVKDTYIDDSLANVLQGNKTVARSVNTYEGDKYAIDFRVRDVESRAEQVYYEQQRREKQLQDQRNREKDLQLELQYSAHNIHQIVNNRTKNLYKDSDALANDTFTYAVKDNESVLSQNFKQNQYPPTQYQQQRNSNNPSNSLKKPTGADIIENYKSNEIVLNYLNNDDFNFNEKQPRSFVERKINEEASSSDHHRHNNPYSKASKHCSACLKQRQLEEKRQKEVTYKGIDLNSLLIQAKDALQKHNYAQSEQLLISVLQRDIDHADVYYLLGETYRLQNRFKEAEKYLLQALLFQFHSPFTYNSLGTVYMQLEQYERAVKLFKKFVEIQEEPKAFFNIGVCLVKLGEPLDSVVYFGRAIELDETQGVYYLHRGDAYDSLGFVDLSLKDYRIYKRLSPEGVKSLESQYSQLMRQGRSQEAKQLENYIKKIRFA